MKTKYYLFLEHSRWLHQVHHNLCSEGFFFVLLGKTINLVPQGSVLRTLLFTVFINDVPEIVDSNALLVLFTIYVAKLSREISGLKEKDAEQEDIGMC